MSETTEDDAEPIPKTWGGIISKTGVQHFVWIFYLYLFIYICLPECCVIKRMHKRLDMIFFIANSLWAIHRQY